MAYDAIWLAALTSGQVGNQTQASILSDALIEAANSFDGITGKTMLNEAGDRISGSYDFWAITMGNGHGSAYEWKRIDTFTTSSKLITLKPGRQYN